MSIQLSSELKELVPGKVSSGQYGSASDVLRNALYLLEEQERYTALCAGEIRGKIAVGYDSLHAGKGVDGDAVFERIVKDLKAIENSPA